MKIEELRSAHERRPFEPFTIHLTDGAAYYISAHEFMAYRPVGRSVFIYHLNDAGYDFIDLNAITRLSHATAPLRPESADAVS